MIIGRSGSGKTVPLKCIVGLIQPTSGQILYDGKNFIGMKGATCGDCARYRDALPGSALFDSKTVLENVMFRWICFHVRTSVSVGNEAEFCLERVNWNTPTSTRRKLAGDDETGGHSKGHFVEPQVPFL